ncbi:hypothetical protein KIN20_018542 [Parelaphostrongylus tenuis]|uniref:Uncharacterized protein n=1 Tax=Parelaphostrongylus tenuis TaxID=148309 RepID=A0AAD5MQ01_PARTN|nr:hypothetical protein KIN20_018542 [Parelaphostrongylus tenuis]
MVIVNVINEKEELLHRNNGEPRQSTRISATILCTENSNAALCLQQNPKRRLPTELCESLDFLMDAVTCKSGYCS